MHRLGVVMAVVWLFGNPAQAGDLVLETIEGPVKEAFDAYRGSWATLPSGFAVFKDSKTLMGPADEDFRGTNAGGVSPGGSYAWLVGAGNYAFGYQPTDEEFTPGYFLLVASNATGTALQRLSVDYSVFHLNNADRSSSLAFEFSLDGTNFTRLAEFTACTPAKKEERAEWTAIRRSGQILFSPRLATGARVWIRWYGQDAGGSGSRDEYGIDDLRLIPRGCGGTVVSLR